MPYLDSKIVGFINFFYDEVKKNKMPWVVNICLYDHQISPYTTILTYRYGGIELMIIRTDMDYKCKKYISYEQITLPKASSEDLAIYIFEEIGKEFDRWNSENH